jgi:hypothetical protein
MLTINASAETSAAPGAVIAAARDFTDRRATIWPNVKAGHFEVHASGETFVEATEYLWPLGFWERCHYEWPAPDCVLATVLDSNVLAPASTWELTVVPIDGGTRVEAGEFVQFSPAEEAEPPCTQSYGWWQRPTTCSSSTTTGSPTPPKATRAATAD